MYYYRKISVGFRDSKKHWVIEYSLQCRCQMGCDKVYSIKVSSFIELD